MHQLDFQVDRRKDLPDSAHWQMLEATAELRQREVAAARGYEEGLQKIQKEHRARVAVLFGRDVDKKLDKYLAFRKVRQDTLRAAMRKVTLGRLKYEKLNELRHRLAGESKTLIQNLGVGLAQIQSLEKPLLQEKERLFKDTIGKGQAVAKASRSKAKNATFRAPYDGVTTYVGSWVTKGDAFAILPAPTAVMPANASTGTVGGYSNMTVSNGSLLSYDSAEVLCRVGVLKWYKMPAIGQVRVSCKLEAIDNFFFGYADNEAGLSAANISESTGFYAQIVSPSVTGIRRWKRGDSFVGAFFQFPLVEWDDSWHLGAWETGHVISLPRIVLPGVFPKNEWVLVNLGIYHHNKFRSLNYGIQSNHGAEFWVKEIGISSTG
ncbi:MAG: hypothetical protein WAM70_18050 [Pyrinomonadaceae bacterium]